MDSALSLRPLLSEKCIILTGGRDRLNNLLIQFPCDTQVERLGNEELQNVILYLASIPGSAVKKAFVFVVDMRGRKYESVKPILKGLQSLQENYNLQIHHVFIIKPDNFWQKQKTSFASSKYSFEHSLISVDQLQKYFDPSQLTPDLDGTFIYNNEFWIEFRIKMELFLNQSTDLVSKLNVLQMELGSFDQPDTREACQEAIIAHNNTKQRVFGINVEQLINEGRSLLKMLNQDVSNANNELIRDSGYSDLSDAGKFMNDYFGEAGKIREPIEQLRTAKQKISSLWQQKKLKLEQCLQLRIFEQDCNQMMEWLNYNTKCVLLNYTDIGQSYSSAYELLQKHEQFHKSCFSGAASIQHITSVASKLIASSHYASNLINLKTTKLDKEWQLFHAILQNRQKILSASCMFHNKADQYLNKVTEWKAHCSGNQAINSVQEAEQLLKKHHELSDEISQIYAEVCNDGKAILDSIQSSQSTQIGQMEFKQAASHILDIVYEILSNHRQLEHLWVSKKQKLQNHYRILNFQQNIKQVYNWLENHGEVFLRRNQNVPKNLMRAKMLHLSHENFVKVLKNTITNVEKLLASADDLVLNGKFEPQQVYSMTKELEQRMTVFLQRVEKRKSILDLSVLFHTHVIEIENWFSELRHQWSALNLNDLNSSSSTSLEIISNCIENLEKHLEVLNEQRTVTKEAVEKTCTEGQSLLDYLRELNVRVNSEQSESAATAQSNYKQSYLNSYNHIESMLKSVRNHYVDVDGKLLTTIKAKLEMHLQIKSFERDALEASQNLDHWSEELKYMDENESDSSRNTDMAESWLHNQIQTANQMQLHVFDLLQRGSDLVQHLENTNNGSDTCSSSSSNSSISSSSTLANTDNLDSSAGTNQHTLNWLKQQNTLKSEGLVTASKRIQSLVEYLNERERELHDLAVRQQRKLGQTLQINQLETECNQLLTYIANVELTLFSLLKFARNLEEAEQIKKEHELFKSNLERISISVSMLQSKVQRILFDSKQQQSQANELSEPSSTNNPISAKFEQLMNTLNSKWQMLLIYIDNRTRLIMAQINFYKYTDQVMTVLESLELEYARDEDWYEKARSDYDPEQYLQAQIQIHSQKKQSFLKACNWARRTGETFQKYSVRNICDANKMNSGNSNSTANNSAVLADIEAQTRRIMDEIHAKEERTIKSWTSRKNALDECFQYVIFEKSSKEALVWLNESEASYLNKFQALSSTSNKADEMDKLYKEFCEFAEKLRNQQGYVNLLIELSPKLLESSVRYGNNIAVWANKVETRYKEFFNVLAKVQQTYGLQHPNAMTSSSFIMPQMANSSSSSSGIGTSTSSLNSQSTITTNSRDLVDKSISNDIKPEAKNNQDMLKQNEQKQKLIKKRQNIITEIIQTEKSYVQDLSNCLETYYKEFVSNVPAQPEYLRGKEAIIFGNLEEIHNFHKKTFLIELEKYENMPEDIGHCFVIYADQFQVYVDYCMNKETSTKLLMDDAKGENYFEKLQRQHQLKCSLDSYLIKPIQRITKYQLLLKDLLTCLNTADESTRNNTEIKEALDVMLSVPKKANDAIHLSLLEGLEADEGLSKETLGDVLLQDKFQVWDSRQLIKKGKDRHVFLFETSLVVAKEVKDQRGKMKYVYKFKMMTSEINITEHMEGDSCKMAVWTGRAPMSDHRVIMRCNSLDIKQLWVKKIRELIQEKYFYMEVAMCEAGQRSNRNSKDFEMDGEFMLNMSNQNGHQNQPPVSQVASLMDNINSSINYSSAASNASSGTKASNDISTLVSDYTTSDNVHLSKGQHVQIIQRVNNETCLVQLINGHINSSSDAASQTKLIELPVHIIKSRLNKVNLDDSNENDGELKSQSAAAAAAAKRKGSFKKWLRSSHRKFTSNGTSTNRAKESQLASNNANSTASNGSQSGAQKFPDSDNMKIKVLSNSEDLKIKSWLSEEANMREEDAANANESSILSPAKSSSSSSNGGGAIGGMSSGAALLLNNQIVTSGPSSVVSNDDDVEDLLLPNSLPPPMNVIRQDQADQNSTSSSFSKIPNQSIDIQRELKLWQSKMESGKGKPVEISGNSDSSNTLINNNINNSQQQAMSSSTRAPSEFMTGNEPPETAPPPPPPPPNMNETKLTYAIRELINTERDYVNDLSSLIDKFMDAMKKNDVVPMPQDMEDGKDKIVFGNILQIYEWHKEIFHPELEKCLTEPTTYIGQLFVKYEKRFQMYVKYCENKPKSEYIVSEYDAYFEELRVRLCQKLNIQDLLIKPVQRIMKYQLMLKEIKKYMEKEGMDCTSINKAIDIMIKVPKNADDMMNVGRLQGFEGRITAQGRLILQDTLLVLEPDDLAQNGGSGSGSSSGNSSSKYGSSSSGGKKSKDTGASGAGGTGSNKEAKLKERRVFLFEQIIIFSEMIGSNKKFTSPRYIFKCDIKVNKLQLKKDDAQNSFTLQDSSPNDKKLTLLCQCEDANKYNNWIKHLEDILDIQNRFLRDLQHPTLAMQKNSASQNVGSSPSSHNNHHHGTSSSTIANTGKNGGAASHHAAAAPTASSSSSSSHHHGLAHQVNDFFKSAFSFGSSNNNNNSSSSAISPSGSHKSASSSSSSASSQKTAVAHHLANNINTSSPKHAVDSLNSDLSQKLHLQTNNNNNNSNIPNCARVVSAYTAITEDEITVSKGDLVQIITANMHNRFLVHREANEHQPAAEGWIPGHVIGFQNTNQ